MLARSLYPRPGIITNARLIKQTSINEALSQDVELELKENLLEHHDFEAVSKQVYETLSDWYGSDFEITRLLKSDPSRPNQLVLDLYPSRKIEIVFYYFRKKS